MILLAVVAAGTAPFAFAGAPLRMAWGLPLWLWCSLLFTLLLAGLTVWGILRYWKDDRLD